SAPGQPVSVWLDTTGRRSWPAPAGGGYRRPWAACWCSHPRARRSCRAAWGGGGCAALRRAGGSVALGGVPRARAAGGGRRGAWTGVAVVAPLLAKRLLGIGPPEGPSRLGVYLRRLVLDRDVTR